MLQTILLIAIEKTEHFRTALHLVKRRGRLNKGYNTQEVWEIQASFAGVYCVFSGLRDKPHYIAYLGTEKGGVTPSVCHTTSVSHTTRNLRHECRRFSIIDQCLSVTPPGICGTFAAEYFSICQMLVI
jgi:hypothetical protein